MCKCPSFFMTEILYTPKYDIPTTAKLLGEIYQNTHPYMLNQITEIGIRGSTPINELQGCGTWGEEDGIGDCVYDRASGLVFDNVSSGMHQIVMAWLMLLMNNEVEDVFFLEFGRKGKLADKYVLEGCGWYVSSITDNIVTMSKNIVMSNDENRVFGSMKIMRI